jgi:2-iminobutanoate/2-iminopropanoate deaminase
MNSDKATVGRRGMKTFFLFPAIFLTITAFAQNTIELVNPSSVSTPHGFSQAAVIDLGTSRMIIISGQVPLDAKGNLIGKDDLEKQTEQVFTNIKNIVEELGGTMKDVIKLGIFTTDVSKIQSIRNVRDKFIDVQRPPTSTLVQVSKLFRDDILIEVEATAVMPKK